MKVSVLRLGHRNVRDDRVTTHIALVARAMGADRIFMTEVNNSIKTTMEEVISGWGGRYFDIEIIENWKAVAMNWKSTGGKIVHLTMYGVNIDSVADELRECDDNILIVVGASKVPRETYEIAALAICLDRIFNGKELTKQFDDAKIRIVPSPNGKKVMKYEHN